MRRIYPQIIMLFHVICGLSITSLAQADSLSLTAAAQSTRSSSSVTLKWNTVGTKATKYAVYRDLLSLIVTTTGTTYVDTRVAGGQTHIYYVVCQSSKGLLPVLSNRVTIKVPTVSVPVPPAAPQGLTASGVWTPGTGSSQGSPEVKLSWTAVTGATSYNLYRGGTLLHSGLTQTTFADTAVTSGQSYSYAVTAIGPGGESAKSSAATVIAPNPPAPPAPAAPQGLTATPQWVTSCPVCNGMAMAHIVLGWAAVTGATSYNLYRGGTLLQSGLTTASDTDMNVSSGQTYTYAVRAVGPGGVGAMSTSASATAPTPPASTMPAGFTAPANLAVNSVWRNGPVDTLTWDSVPGAASYNVYQYEKLIAKGVTGTSYTIPTNMYNVSMTYSVTAVDDDCSCETIPSNIAGAGSVVDPNNVPSWVSHAVPTVPTSLVATPEWNGGMPRIHITWVGNGDTQVYNVYRDGHKVAAGMWGLSWFDNHVQPGETHSYRISSVNTCWPGGLESVPSIPVSATALTAAPAPYNGKVQITGVVPNDNSALVSFAAVPGAVDYCVYDVTNPGMVKYSGGSLSIEWNGITPATGADLVVEAVDKLGPFQTSDGMTGPGSTTMSGTMNDNINGQGDPSDLPIVLAKSDAFHVTCQSKALTGAQAFFDDFTNAQPFAPATPEPAIAALADPFNEIQDVQNDKWRIRQYRTDTQMSSTFIMNNHFMDTLYDGPTAATTPFSHNNNASVVMMPKATADISGGKVLHVTFEVDAHMDGRRWVDCFVIPVGDSLLCAAPTKLENNEFPTTSGNMFFWQIAPANHQAVEVIRGVQQPLINVTYSADPILGPSQLFSPAARNGWGGATTNYNGSSQDLDKRHRFDLYFSQTHFRLMENGNVVEDRDMVTPLPFSRCQVCFVHELYHTANDRGELLSYDPSSSYYYNYRPWADERHWDNMGFEVLPSLPN